MSNEKDLKKILLDDENKIVKCALKYCGDHTLEFSKEHNKLLRIALRKFYKETIYPHLRELNINAPRKYEE
jgi:hypothetical protein